MNVICEKAGTREKCVDCKHSSVHEWNPVFGCQEGSCWPPKIEKNTIDGSEIIIKQFYPCIEFVEKIVEEKEIT